MLCASLGSPTNPCGSPPGSLGKHHSLDNLGFHGDLSGSYKKAPGCEREDSIGTDYLKSFKSQVSSPVIMAALCALPERGDVLCTRLLPELCGSAAMNRGCSELSLSLYLLFYEGKVKTALNGAQKPRTTSFAVKTGKADVDAPNSV